jgi:TatD DNase family protein
VAESRASLGLAHREKDVYVLAGVHPHEAKDVWHGHPAHVSHGPPAREEEAGQGRDGPDTHGQDARATSASHYLAQLQQLAADPRNVGIGEIGLDYHYDFSPRPAQQQVFAEQLDLARRMGKQVVIHTREAIEDTLAIVARSGIDGTRIVFHSFTEHPAAARRVLDLGATISFSGIVTFARSAELQQTALLVPADRILVETDAPYLSPEPVRKMKTNEPANVAHVAAFLARLRGASADEFAQQTTANACRFFGITL